MSNNDTALHDEVKQPFLSTTAQRRYTDNLQQAEALLAAFMRGDKRAIARFESYHPQGKQTDFLPTLQDARLLVSSESTRVRRLSLEKLKREAKELYKALKIPEADSIKRFRQYHPHAENKPATELKLADAQWIIARENGLTSWPKLKEHIELMNRAEDQLRKPRFDLDSDMKTLHIRCGTDIQATLPVCGFRGDFLEVSNPFPQGPVPPLDPVNAFITTRSQFIKQNYAGYVPDERIDQTPREIEHVETTLRELPGEYGRVALWFEHDPFDQLCMAYVLTHLTRRHLKHTKIELIQADSFPGVTHFIGMGQLCKNPESLVALWQQRTNVTPA